MKITNTLGLPKPYELALTPSARSPDTLDRYSVTALISPPQARQLALRHDAEIEVDVSENVWMLLGSGVHRALDAAGVGSWHSEVWLESDFSGVRVVGRADLLCDGVLYDTKVVSGWSFALGVRDEWRQQLNIYAELARRKGLAVVQLSIFAVIRDWKQSLAREGGDYPLAAVHLMPVENWGAPLAESFIRQRIALHQAAAALSDGQLPPCAPSERWERAMKWAVTKRGRKRATRLYDTQAEANTHAAKLPGAAVTCRLGANVRCESYCKGAPWCAQWAMLREREALAKAIHDE